MQNVSLCNESGGKVDTEIALISQGSSHPLHGALWESMGIHPSLGSLLLLCLPSAPSTREADAELQLLKVPV